MVAVMVVQVESRAVAMRAPHRTLTRLQNRCGAGQRLLRLATHMCSRCRSALCRCTLSMSKAPTTWGLAVAARRARRRWCLPPRISWPCRSRGCCGCTVSPPCRHCAKCLGTLTCSTFHSTHLEVCCKQGGDESLCKGESGWRGCEKARLLSVYLSVPVSVSVCLCLCLSVFLSLRTCLPRLPCACPPALFFNTFVSLIVLFGACVICLVFLCVCVVVVRSCSLLEPARTTHCVHSEAIGALSVCEPGWCACQARRASQQPVAVGCSRAFACDCAWGCWFACQRQAISFYGSQTRRCSGLREGQQQQQQQQ